MWAREGWSPRGGELWGASAELSSPQALIGPGDTIPSHVPHMNERSTTPESSPTLEAHVGPPTRRAAPDAHFEDGTRLDIKGLCDLDLFGLHALLASGRHEGDGLTFLEGLEALDLDGFEVDGEVVTTLRRDETVALLVVEPLHHTTLAITHNDTAAHSRY